MNSYPTRSIPSRRGSRLAVATIGAAAWTGLLVGGGALPHAAADSHETPAPTSTPAPQVENASSTDVRFATMMVPHHRTGIEMTQMAIEKATTPGVRDVAQAAQQSQQSQLPVLEAIAASGSAPHEMEEPLMTFNEQEMAELRSLTGEAFDKKWLDTFSSHHMSAIMMADTALPGATSDQARAIEQEIHDGQLQQLATMNQLREQLSGQVSLVPTGAAETGGGSTADPQNGGLIATGAGLVVAGAAGGALALRRRSSAGR
ncbi:DUF305 domain-containing protein [Geodermatophilus sp. DSM 45219]|uniref:DUF305 domain-containing protein n=1 Tax=Geodermatophilus sp. DSM 45219 TaxID=1881103 RepID=UPI00088D0C7D|nr:DUF305 domain-containing protein [Geodermatophilus sp. DSM 45219]SDO37557.1 Uncharacterized conserved protein, DUF305 family [Geodermatophilus sp. DSM 45219]